MRRKQAKCGWRIQLICVSTARTTETQGGGGCQGSPASHTHPWKGKKIGSVYELDSWTPSVSEIEKERVKLRGQKECRVSVIKIYSMENVSYIGLVLNVGMYNFVTVIYSRRASQDKWILYNRLVLSSCETVLQVILIQCCVSGNLNQKWLKMCTRTSLASSDASNGNFCQNRSLTIWYYEKKLDLWVIFFACRIGMLNEW